MFGCWRRILSALNVNEHVFMVYSNEFRGAFARKTSERTPRVNDGCVWRSSTGGVDDVRFQASLFTAFQQWLRTPPFAKALRRLLPTQTDVEWGHSGAAKEHSLEFCLLWNCPEMSDNWDKDNFYGRSWLLPIIAKIRFKLMKFSCRSWTHKHGSIKS